MLFKKYMAITNEVLDEPRDSQTLGTLNGSICIKSMKSGVH